MEITIAIADDTNIYRMILCKELNIYKDIKIKFEAVDGPDLLSKLKSRKVDLILLDLNMPEMDGIQVLKEIRKTDPLIKVLMLTHSDDKNDIINMFLAKANGYIIKDSNSEAIYNAIKTCAEKLYYFNEYIFSVLLEKLFLLKDFVFNARDSKIKFTDNEIQIIKLICEEKSSEEIAAELHLGRFNVDKIRTNIHKKTNTKTVIGLFKFALINYIVTI
jgi:DNA-binding NarL/FixJ family response regulator